MKNIVVVIGLVLIGILLFGCVNFQSPKTCKEYASALVPKYLNLTWSYSEDFEQEYLYWTDGTKIPVIYDEEWGRVPYGYCWSEGNEAGENTNYLYHSPNFPMGARCRTSLDYSKEVIDKEGNILGTRYFTSEPILKLYANSTNTSSWSSYIYEVINPNIITCYWITDEGKVINQTN